MSCIEKREEFKPITSRSFSDNVRNGLLNIYNKKGESNESLHEINLLTREYYRQLQNTPFYWNDLKPLITDAAECNDYHAYTLCHDDNIKLSVHVMPKGTEIPMHSHPGKFCLTMIEYGSLYIIQHSLGQNRFTQGMNSEYKLLSRGETCIGLPVKNNMHQLKAMSDVAVFISLRVSTEESDNKNSIIKLFSRRDN
jgi:hypothetical protein